MRVQGEPLFAVSALRLRAIDALFRGDRAAAEQYRVQTELLQIPNSPPQLFEGSQAVQWIFGYAAIGDLLRVKQYVVEVEILSREHAGYRPVLHAGRGAYQVIRGDYVRASRARARAGDDAGREPPVWSFAAGWLVWALARQDRHLAAVARGEQLLETMRAANIVGNQYVVLIPLAVLSKPRRSIGGGALGDLDSHRFFECGVERGRATRNGVRRARSDRDQYG